MSTHTFFYPESAECDEPPLLSLSFGASLDHLSVAFDPEDFVVSSDSVWLSVPLLFSLLISSFSCSLTKLPLLSRIPAEAVGVPR